MDKFTNLFSDGREYPQFFDEEEILPMGMLYSYVGHSFLDGLVNHTVNQRWSHDQQRAVLVNRYFDEADQRDLGMTKRQNLDVIMAKERHRTELHQLRDDVAILSCRNGIFWFYYYDCDVSDCMIGRFRSAMPFDEVYALMLTFIVEMNHVRNYSPMDQEPYWELSSEVIKGWVSW